MLTPRSDPTLARMAAPWLTTAAVILCLAVHIGHQQANFQANPEHKIDGEV